MLVLSIAAGVLSKTAERVYSASASLFVSIDAGGSPSDLVQGSTYAQNQISSFAELASMPVVLEPVIDRLGLDTSVRQLARSVSVETPRDTVILVVTVEGTSPADVASTANAVADQLSTVVSDIAPRGEGGQSAVEATIVEPATEPDQPIAPNTRRNLLAALLAGIVLGLATAYLRELLDTKIRTAADVEGAAGVPVLAAVAREARSGDRTASARALRTMQSEEFSRLRVNLQTVGLDDATKCFVFSSAIAGEGKTYSCARAAAALAATGTRVLLIDADLRRPTVADHFAIEGGVGLTEVMVGRATAEESIQTVAPNLSVLPAGSVPANPGELLASHAFAALLLAWREAYDVVLIDSPPVLPVADAVVLSRQATGTILVVDANRVKKPQVRHSVEAIELGGGRVVGAVLNRTRRPPVDPYVTASLNNVRRPAEVVPRSAPKVRRARDAASRSL
jgi:succinoglycan biosynthesis transport protein ExoP